MWEVLAFTQYLIPILMKNSAPKEIDFKMYFSSFLRVVLTKKSILNSKIKNVPPQVFSLALHLLLLAAGDGTQAAACTTFQIYVFCTIFQVFYQAAST